MRGVLRFAVCLLVGTTIAVGAAWADGIITAKDGPPAGQFRSFEVEADGSFVPCISLTTPKGVALSCDWNSAEEQGADIEVCIEESGSPDNCAKNEVNGG